MIGFDKYNIRNNFIEIKHFMPVKYWSFSNLRKQLFCCYLKAVHLCSIYAATKQQTGAIIKSYYCICNCIYCVGLNLFFYTSRHAQFYAFYAGRHQVFIVRNYTADLVCHSKRKTVLPAATEKLFSWWQPVIIYRHRLYHLG